MIFTISIPNMLRIGRSDGYFVAESKPWKEVDGKFYYLEDIEGEIMGSEIDPYFEIKVQPDGSLMYCMDMLLLERV